MSIAGILPMEQARSPLVWRLASGAPLRDLASVDLACVDLARVDLARVVMACVDLACVDLACMDLACMDLKAHNTASESYFGFSVALDADGQVIAVGAPYESGSSPGINGDPSDLATPSAGAVYIYTFE